MADETPAPTNVYLKVGAKGKVEVPREPDPAPDPTPVP